MPSAISPMLPVSANSIRDLDLPPQPFATPAARPAARCGPADRCHSEPCRRACESVGLRPDRLHRLWPVRHCSPRSPRLLSYFSARDSLVSTFLTRVSPLRIPRLARDAASEGGPQPRWGETPDASGPAAILRQVFNGLTAPPRCPLNFRRGSPRSVAPSPLAHASSAPIARISVGWRRIEAGIFLRVRLGLPQARRVASGEHGAAASSRGSFTDPSLHLHLIVP